MRMHDEQLEIDADLVRGLLTQQFPDIAELPIEHVESTGTVNALFRIGDGFVARLPLVEWWTEGIEREWRWLPWLAERVASLRIPEPVFMGRSSGDYPFPWAVHRWIDGEVYDDDLVSDERSAAATLAAFVLELRSIELVHGAPRGGRRPLQELDVETRERIGASEGKIDVTAALRVWEDAVRAPAWNGEAAWIHADLLRPNLLVSEGRLRAVIDFGGAGIGDPATDLIAAWSVFGSEGREAYREALRPDTASWVRGRGIALHQAAGIIPYYAETNPTFVSLAVRTIEEIISDFAADCAP